MRWPRWLFAPPKPPKKTPIPVPVPAVKPAPKARGPVAYALKNRTALLKREQKATRDIARLYKAAQKSIETELQRVLAKIAAARAIGQEVTQHWLVTEARLGLLLQQIEGQTHRFALDASAVAEKAQAANVARGTADAYGAMQAAAKYAGIDAAFTRLPATALEHLAGFLSDGAPLERLFRELGPQAAKLGGEALFDGVAQGKGIKSIARDVREATGVSRNRAQLIARTESLRAYRSATLESYQANAQTVQGWRWLCSFSVRTCVFCIAQDGTEHPSTEQMATHPACRCCQEAVLVGTAEGEPRKTGSEWFGEQDAETRASILGPVKAALYDEGKIGLSDLVETGTNAKWGDWGGEKSLRSLIGEGTISSKDVAEATGR